MTGMLLSTGVWMFLLHTSLNIEGTVNYYAPKSIFGLLETVSPHLFGMGLLVFILTHFFAIIKHINQKIFISFSICFFIWMLLMNISGFFIVEQGWFFAVIKLVSTLLFVGYTFFAIYKLFKISGY